MTPVFFLQGCRNMRWIYHLRAENGKCWENIDFWCALEKEYPELGKCALIEHLSFGSTNMCKVTSVLTHIKNRQRNRLYVENNLVIAVSTLAPELTKLIKDRQAWVFKAQVTDEKKVQHLQWVWIFCFLGLVCWCNVTIVKYNKGRLIILIMCQYITFILCIYYLFLCFYLRKCLRFNVQIKTMK